MAWGTISVDATWLARLRAPIIRPAVFIYLDWPTGEVRASTHHKSVTVDGNAWTGVGNLARIDAPTAKRSSARQRYTLGLTSLPQGDVDDTVQASAIGTRAILYFGLFDEAWEDPLLERVFIGHVLTAGDFKHRRDDSTGDWVTDASIEVSNGRSPRRQLRNHHSPETAEAGDTAWRLLPTAGRTLIWPE